MLGLVFLMILVGLILAVNVLRLLHQGLLLLRKILALVLFKWPRYLGLSVARSAWTSSRQDLLVFFFEYCLLLHFLELEVVILVDIVVIGTLLCVPEVDVTRNTLQKRGRARRRFRLPAFLDFVLGGHQSVLCVASSPIVLVWISHHVLRLRLHFLEVGTSSWRDHSLQAGCFLTFQVGCIELALSLMLRSHLSRAVGRLLDGVLLGCFIVLSDV